MSKAVIYCRVSSPDQVKNGHGLSSQETRCREFAKYRTLEVAEVFQEEGISGGLIDRPAMKRMLAYLRQHKKEQIVVIIDDISRLARDLKAHLELRMAIQDAGGILQSPSIEFGEDSDSQLVENLLASVSQHHRQKNAEQVKNRMRARLLNGYWILATPRGYKVEKRAGHGKMLVPDEPVASIIKEGLEGFAIDRFGSVVDLQAFFQSQPDFPKDRSGKVHIQRVLDMLGRKLYTGYYEYPEWDIPLMEGKHEALISFETYRKIQDKLHGRARVPVRRDINQDFPLRGFVVCDGCHAPLKSCWTKGRNGKYPYYLCHTQGCPHYGKSVRKDKIEGEFDQLLQSMTPTREMLVLTEHVVTQVHGKKMGEYGSYLSGLEQQKKAIERKVDQLVGRIVAADSPTLVMTYERQVKQLEEQCIVIEQKLKKCGTVDTDFLTSARTAFDFLGKAHQIWVTGDLPAKRLVLKLAFDERIVYHRNEGYRTAAYSLPFRLTRALTHSKSEMVEATSTILT